MPNATTPSVFSLSGLNEMPVTKRLTLFSFTLLCYCVILIVNGVLIVTVILEEKLHEPMYIFLCNLSINSIYGTAGFYPKFLFDLLSNTHVISYTGCLLQVFVIYTFVATDFSILTLMAYDRYVAICQPLQYHSVMTKHRVIMLVCFSRLVPFLCMATMFVMTYKLELCGSHIEKLYCDNWSIVKLSCNPVSTNNILGFIIIFFYLGHDLFIMFSYVRLIRLALKSGEGRKRFIETCVPHLLCLLNVSVALMFDLMYTRYGSSSISHTVKNFMAIQFLVLPPILNPVIYGLKLTQVRNSFLCFCSANQQVKGLG